jgi:hypothetical protein
MTGPPSTGTYAEGQHPHRVHQRQIQQHRAATLATAGPYRASTHTLSIRGLLNSADDVLDAHAS